MDGLRAAGQSPASGHLVEVLDRLLREGAQDWAQVKIERLRQEREVLA